MAPLCSRLLLLPALALALGPASGLEAPGEAEELAAGMAAELRAAGLPGDLPELEPECRRLLTAFAEGSATLSACLAHRARPVRLCQACGGLYRSLLTQYGDIARAVGNSSESHNCAKSILTSDRLQVVVTLSAFFNDTWEAANCANCIKNNSEGLSNSTQEFMDLFNKSLTCFEHNLQGQAMDLSPNNYTEVCKNCNGTYKNLNDLYNKLQRLNRHGDESGHSAHLCIDVEDAMNITRKLWSRTFNCSVPCSDTVPVIAVSSFILFLPVVFYLSSFLHSKQKKRILILQREFRAPSLGSLENCMKLSQMTVQGLQQFKSPLLQLPHIEEDNLRRVSNHKKYKIKSIQDLVSLKGSDRRNLLHFLEDKKYDEVMAVLGSFPYVTMDIKPQVLDDEDSNNITVGSLVTVLVTLTRQTMAEVFEKEQSICSAEEQPAEDGQGDSNKVKSKGWQQKNKGTKKAAKSKKKKPLKKKPVPPSLQPPKQQKQKQANGEVVVKEEEEEISDKGSESEEEETNRDSQSEKDDGSDRESDREQDEKQNKDDEAEWQELQQSIQRKERALLETKSKITHPVYSLFFPEEKQEWWWLYIADRKEQMLICMPYHVCTLKDKEEVELKFPAPGKPGNYQYTVYLRSDSYMGLDQIKPLKLEVHEAKPVPENHPQWDTAIEGDEDQEDSEGFEDSFEEEEEEEEDDD